MVKTVPESLCKNLQVTTDSKTREKIKISISNIKS
jgi:hypothetical protein